MPRIPRYGRLTHEQDRLGLTGSMQWQPNDANLINLDLLYSDFNAKRDENFLEAFSFSRTGAQGGKPQTIVRGGEIDANGTLVYGLFDDVDIRSESRYDELETQFYSVTLSAEHQLNEQWSIDELVGYSRSDFNNPDPDHDHAGSLQQRRLFVGLPRQQPAAELQLQLRRDQSGQLGLPELWRRLLVGNPPAPAGRRQHLPGGQDRPEVRAHRKLVFQAGCRLQEVQLRVLGTASCF